VNIYLKVEILAREIEGRLLLALAAAERGHRVLMGDFKALLSHRLWLPPGIYHDNSLTPSAKKLALHARLRDSGFLVTSQDEEHGLLDEFGTWEDFAARRFSSESLAGAARSFMWGPHDHATLSRLHPESADRIVRTSSPRADLWRPALDEFYAGRELPGIDAERPFILFAHQSAIVLDRNPFWQRIADQRQRYFTGDDDDREWGWYRRCVGEVRYLEHLVPAIRAVGRANPQAQLVIRPHPLDAEGAWEAIVGDVPNVIVARGGTASGWIRRAAMVVHNGSTIGFEAAASARPLVSFRPTDDRADFVSNRLGRSARSSDELVALARLALGASVQINLVEPLTKLPAQPHLRRRVQGLRVNRLVVQPVVVALDQLQVALQLVGRNLDRVELVVQPPVIRKRGLACVRGGEWHGRSPVENLWVIVWRFV
jgi:surface carbohydrate biosynthesis protein